MILNDFSAILEEGFFNCLVSTQTRTRVRVLIQKLNYLRRLVNKGDDKLSSQIFHLFASKDISQLTIVEQCRYLEDVYDTDFTGEILSCTVTWKCMKKRILTADKMLDLVQSIKQDEKNEFNMFALSKSELTIKLSFTNGGNPVFFYLNTSKLSKRT